MSDFVRSYILLIIAAVAGAVYALRRYYKTEQGKSTIDALLLKVPVFGTLIRKVAVARFTRTLGTLVSSGVPILEGLRITARTAGNKVVEKAVMQCRAAVTAGQTLAEPLKALRRVPAHGHADDHRRRADGRPRRHAVQDRRLLRRRGRHRGQARSPRCSSRS